MQKRIVKTRNGHADILSVVTIAENVELNLSLDGTKPALSSNVDFTGDEACKSQVTQLNALRIFNASSFLAFFNFDTQNCGARYNAPSFDMWAEKNSDGSSGLKTLATLDRRTVDLGHFMDVYSTEIVGQFKSQN